MKMTSTPSRTSFSPLPNITGLGGAIAGLAGGAAMLLIGAILSIVVGHDIWAEAKQIAAPLFGASTAMQPGFVAAPVIVGTIIHFLIAALLGALFGIVVRRVFHLPTAFGSSVVAGLIYGFAVWMLAYFVLLPIFNPVLAQGTYAPSFIIQHLVYGIVTGLVYSRLRTIPYVDESRYAA